METIVSEKSTWEQKQQKQEERKVEEEESKAECVSTNVLHFEKE